MKGIKKISTLALTLMFAVMGSMVLAGFTSIHSTSEQAQTLYKQRGGTIIGTVSETIYYDDRTISSDSINPITPAYMSNYSCGITAGGVVVSWYNHLSGIDLISSHFPGFWLSGKYQWANQNTAIDNMFTTIHTEMGGGSGVTITQYLTGLGSYVIDRGHSMSIGLVSSGGALTSGFKTAIANNKPVTLFLDGFNIMAPTGHNTFSGYDTVYFVEYEGGHVMIAYGYHIVTYKNNGVTFREDTYLLVQTGFGGNDMMRISSHCTLDAAYTTHIT